MAKFLRITLALAAFVLFAAIAGAAEWGTIGAGNATCEHWNRANANTKIEILSWMAGYASAENLDRASEGRPEFRLELLTYDYLRNEIQATCSNARNKNEGMLGILLKILVNFPTVKK